MPLSARKAISDAGPCLPPARCSEHTQVAVLTIGPAPARASGRGPQSCQITKAPTTLGEQAPRPSDGDSCDQKMALQRSAREPRRGNSRARPRAVRTRRIAGRQSLHSVSEIGITGKVQSRACALQRTNPKSGRPHPKLEGRHGLARARAARERASPLGSEASPSRCRILIAGRVCKDWRMHTAGHSARHRHVPPTPLWQPAHSSIARTSALQNHRLQ